MPRVEGPSPKQQSCCGHWVQGTRAPSSPRPEPGGNPFGLTWPDATPLSNVAVPTPDGSRSSPLETLTQAQIGNDDFFLLEFHFWSVDFPFMSSYILYWGREAHFLSFFFFPSVFFPKLEKYGVGRGGENLSIVHPRGSLPKSVSCRLLAGGPSLSSEATSTASALQS